MADPVIRLKPGKERPVRLGHPWIFSGAVDGLDPHLEPGTVVAVRAADGSYCGRGYINPRCAIAVRMLTREAEAIDTDFFIRRIRAAQDLRTALLADTTAYRLLNAEGDFLPGFVADRYGEIIVLQCLTAGADRMRASLVEALSRIVQPRGIYERSGGSVRREEGLPTREGVVAGEVSAEPILIEESGLRFLVDVRSGQKTGFFLDQRDNRILVRAVSGARVVLNAFGYTGAFAVYAGAGGASRVVSVESSVPALRLARRNWTVNGLPEERAELVEADVFDYLRQTDQTFDVLVLDPPALVKRRHDVTRGARAYKDLHRWAFRRAAPGAFVVTFSCSQHVPLELFRKIVQSGAHEAERTVQVLTPLAASIDHPQNVTHPEGDYLKGLLLRVM